jgi:NitT/TauT family transport system permease protein
MKRLINQVPSKTTNLFLGLIPFLLIVVVYVGSSNARLAKNPNDKLLPSIEKCIDSMSKMAFEKSKRSGK